MKLAILGESPADEAAVRVLAGAVLGAPCTVVRPALRARGWPNVEQVLPAVARHLHFHTDAVGLVIVVDADDSPVHTAAHEAPGHHHPLCRICRLRAVFRRATRTLPPARGRAGVLRAVGLAVPALEAWLLCGRAEGVTEAAWVEGRAAGRLPYTRRELKLQVYGTSRPSLAWECVRAVAEARRHASDVRRLEHDFPEGFGALARDLRSWRSPVPPGSRD